MFFSAAQWKCRSTQNTLHGDRSPNGELSLHHSWNKKTGGKLCAYRLLYIISCCPPSGAAAPNIRIRQSANRPIGLNPPTSPKAVPLEIMEWASNPIRGLENYPLSYPVRNFKYPIFLYSPYELNDRSWISYRSQQVHLRWVEELFIFLSYTKWPILKFRFTLKIPFHNRLSFICVFPSSTIIISRLTILLTIRHTLMLGLSHNRKAAHGRSGIDNTVEPP